MNHGTALTDRIIAAFNAGDVDAFAACFAEDAVQIHPLFPAPLRGRAAIRAAEASLFGSFGDITLRLTNLVEAADQIAAEFTVTATNTEPIPLPDGSSLPATGKTVELSMGAFFRLDGDGLITESHRYQDNLAFMQQLGMA